MGAWIEILFNTYLVAVKASHPTMGAWIEIKLFLIINLHHQLSHPTMGAWIEMQTVCMPFLSAKKSHPTMGAWIEIFVLVSIMYFNFSRTPRWVRGLKFVLIDHCYFLTYVAPHDGCVD